MLEMSRSAPWKVAGLVLFALLITSSVVSCGRAKAHDPAPGASLQPEKAAPAPLAPVATVQPSAAHGNLERGKQLMEKFECSRCHDGTGLAAAPLEKHCVTCHEDITTGKFRAPADKLAKWKKNVAHVREVPSLEFAGRRFEREWLIAFLREPSDMRPHLVPTMPRLALSDSDARDVAAYMLRDAPTMPASPAAPDSGGDAALGRQLFEQKGCGSCHAFSGAEGIATAPDPNVGADAQRRAVRLAPDLRHARDRLRPAQVVAWLLDPLGVKPGTLMPSSSLTATDARHLAAFVLTAPLAPPAVKPIPKRLAVLERKVGFEEVMEKVLGKTCRHCHSDPDVSLGDGGPGNTGGFGFSPRRLNLASYSGVAGGLLDQQGERQSVFAKVSDGTPRLVAGLMARYAEEAGQPNPELRGMPLGLPPLPLEEIQLVESWIAQGRPR
jgi:mono/diheme cytochrome c family protein